MKKTRADSILGTLPDERQADIADYCRTHTLRETRDWLKADGIKISSDSLSRWFSSWSLRQRFTQSESSALQFKDWLATAFPKMSEADLDARAAMIFQFEALKTGDPETYLAFATARQRAKKDDALIRLKEQAGAREERRIRLLEQKAAQADEARKVVSSEELSDAEKQQRMRQIFGLS